MKPTMVPKMMLMMANAMMQCQSGKWTSESCSKDIVDTAVGAGNFATLAKALAAASMVDALKGNGPFTVLAPTDEAFAKLPVGTLQELLNPENKDRLKAILAYHVVPGKLLSGQLSYLTGLKTLEGKSLTVAAEGGNVMVGKAKVVKADIPCSNGVIHVIDTVLLPE